MSDAVFYGLGKLETALAQRDALASTLKKIEIAAHKSSLTPAERLQDIRIILSDVGSPSGERT